MVQEWSRESLTRHQSYPTRYHHGPDPPDQRRYYDAPETARHQPPMAIDTALRSHCGIWAKQYFVAVLMEDGTPTTFFSPGQRLSDSMLRQFFDPHKFQQVANQIDRAPPSESSRFDGGMYYRSIDGHRYRSTEKRHKLPDSSDDPVFRFARKRHRPRHPVEDDEEMAPPVVMSRRGIRVSDTKALWNFYDQRFKSCQQSACKLIAKAWVKAVEPKKQSTHPYTGSDEKAPDWWPKPWGMTKEDKVRHKEPDHLYKRERVHLLNHILDMVMEPAATQHYDIRKLGLTVRKLEECTNEALSGFYAESHANASKKQYLNEIFRVARQQERYKNREIDGTTEVYVLSDERFYDHHSPDQDDSPFIKMEDDQHRSPSSRSSATQSFLHTPTTGRSPPTTTHGGSFVNELPMRSTQQPSAPTATSAPSAATAPTAPMMHELTPPGQQQYVEETLQVNGVHGVNGVNGVNGTPAVNGSGGNMAVEMVPSPHDDSRRASMYGEYSSMGSSGMYTTAQWPAGSAPPSSQSLYTGGQNDAQAQSFVQPVAVSHGQQYVTEASVEGLPRQGYDANSTGMFRPINMPPASVPQSQGYNIISTDGRSYTSLPGVSEVIDSVPRGQA